MEKIIRVKNLRKAYKKKLPLRMYALPLHPEVSWDYWGQTKRQDCESS